MSRCFRSHIRFSIISALIILPFSFTANSALSATTTKTIQGTAPSLSESLISEIQQGKFSLLGFKFGDEDKEYYDTNLSSLYIDPAQYSPASLTSAIKGVVKSPTGTEAIDNDGDGNFGLSAKTVLAVSAEIYDDSNNKITSNTKTFRELLCSSTASKPYTAKIKIAGDLSLTTAYGDPRNKNYTDSTPETNTQPSKEYEVPISAICNLKPASLQIYTTGVSISGGYNIAKFDPVNGFKVASGFPTTGFYKAVFSIIGSGNDQSKYRCSSSDNGGKINLSGASSASLGLNCTVTYNSVTKSAFTAGGLPTITMEYSEDGSTNWKQIDSFTIPTPTKWAIGKGASAYKSGNNNLTINGVFSAANLCAGNNLGTITPATARNYFFARNELTNSLIANQPAANQATGGHFSRDTEDVKSTFMGEWGSVYSYTGSGWATSNGDGIYWTSETQSSIYQFTVFSDGQVLFLNPLDSNRATVCRDK